MFLPLKFDTLIAWSSWPDFSPKLSEYIYSGYAKKAIFSVISILWIQYPTKSENIFHGLKTMLCRCASQYSAKLKPFFITNSYWFHMWSANFFKLLVDTACGPCDVRLGEMLGTFDSWYYTVVMLSANNLLRVFPKVWYMFGLHSKTYFTRKAHQYYTIIRSLQMRSSGIAADEGRSDPAIETRLNSDILTPQTVNITMFMLCLILGCRRF